MSESKEMMRVEALRHRSLIDPASENIDNATELFFKTVKPQTGQVIAAYWPSRKEFSPFGIMERLFKEGFTCALPVTPKDERLLKFAQWADGDPLDEGLYGIQEPFIKKWIEPDIFIIPLLAFDRRGYRLGYGGGYYDATLAELRNKRKIMAVGLGYAKQACLFNLPVEDHDIKLDYVITPQAAHDFT